jgi:hypothetical protein
MTTRRQGFIVVVVVVAALAVCWAGTAGAQHALFLTDGAGWITVNTGGRGSFSLFAALKQDGTFRGRVDYTNHDTGLTLRSTSITSFIPGLGALQCASQITGSADSNFGPVTFTVIVSEGIGGDPDSFSIQVTGAAAEDTQSGPLQGGHINACQ